MGELADDGLCEWPFQKGMLVVVKPVTDRSSVVLVVQPHPVGTSRRYVAVGELDSCLSYFLALADADGLAVDVEVLR